MLLLSYSLIVAKVAVYSRIPLQSPRTIAANETLIKEVILYSSRYVWL